MVRARCGQPARPQRVLRALPRGRLGAESVRAVDDGRAAALRLLRGRALEPPDRAALPRGHRLPRADREPAARPRHDLPLSAAARASAGGTVRRVLRLCAEAGLLRVGVVALDGTKLRANASRERNRTDAELEAEVRRILAEAERVDAAEHARFGDARGDELPAGFRDRGERLQRLREARERLAVVSGSAGGLRGTPQEPRAEGPARAPPAAAAARPGREGERHRPGQPRGARLSRLLPGLQRAGGDE